MLSHEGSVGSGGDNGNPLEDAEEIVEELVAELVAVGQMLPSGEMLLQMLPGKRHPGDPHVTSGCCNADVGFATDQRCGATGFAFGVAFSVGVIIVGGCLGSFDLATSKIDFGRVGSIIDCGRQIDCCVGVGSVIDCGVGSILGTSCRNFGNRIYLPISGFA